VVVVGRLLAVFCQWLLHRCHRRGGVVAAAFRLRRALLL